MRTLLVSLLAFLALSNAAGAQSTTLTYQGRLKHAGEPASGLHDFRFRLFDAAQGGNQLGDLQCLNNITVADGLFTASIDFGQQFASPDGRFLEIQVREDTGLNCNNANGFVTLNPRQPLTPAPLASHANSAFALDAADGGPADAVFVDNNGLVGVGTTTPGVPLHVAAGIPVVLLQDTGLAQNQTGYLDFRDNNMVETAYVGFGEEGSPHFSIVNARPAGNINLVPFSGNVGVGTTSPTAKLEVHGDIRLGSSGELRAPGGVENLRIVRGTVGTDGTILEGSGFTCSHNDFGKYTITFTTSFADVPAVTASPDADGNNIARRLIAMPDSVTAGKTDVHVVLAVNGFINGSFHFIAVGPR